MTFMQCTFVIFPPLKLVNRFSEMVRTLELRWMVNLFEAVTIFLHLPRQKNITISLSESENIKIKQFHMDTWFGL